MATPTNHALSSTPAELAVPLIPPLQSGDELSRDEFERRYHAMPDVKKAELIEGVVYMPSPVRVEKHGRPHNRISMWIGFYEAGTPGVIGTSDSTVRLDLKNEPQPDCVLIIDPKFGGTVKLVDDYIEGAPDLVVEVSASSVSIDMNAKFRAYHRNQVREYLVWRVLDQAIDWFTLQGSEYQPIAPDSAGLLRSQVFPGLWLDREALLAGDMTKLIQALRTGLADPSHKEFVKQLAASAR